MGEKHAGLARLAKLVLDGDWDEVLIASMRPMEGEPHGADAFRGLCQNAAKIAVSVLERDAGRDNILDATRHAARVAAHLWGDGPAPSHGMARTVAALVAGVALMVRERNWSGVVETTGDDLPGGAAEIGREYWNLTRIGARMMMLNPDERVERRMMSLSDAILDMKARAEETLAPEER